MPATLPPIRFEPRFTSNIWGGARLRPWLNRPASPVPTGEAWILSDVDGLSSVATTAPFIGQNLRDIMAKHGPELLGAVPPINGRFPLLLKFIDALQELSVQTHPDDAQARAIDPAAAGKTEAWVILDANPSTSRIYAGFNRGMSESAFRAAIATKTVPATLARFVPKPGDCVFLKANTVHAIGADILLFEVQQTSNITYRLYDWDRVDAATGLPRELHIEAGIRASDFASGPVGPVVPKVDGERECLVNCDYFQLERWTLRRPVSLAESNGCCRIITVIAGHGTLDGESITLGDTVLIPAAARVESLIPIGQLVVLVSTPRSPQ
jgi:mannose-6-phosphate isomerase